MSVKHKKRHWSDDEKRSICFQTRASGISVAQVARRYAMNANLIFKWLKEPRFLSAQQETEESAFLPVEISAEPEAALPSLHQSAQVRASCVRSGRRPAPTIEIVTTDGHRLTVEGDFDGDALARLLKGLVS